jgi:hypothetical protein
MHARVGTDFHINIPQKSCTSCLLCGGLLRWIVKDTMLDIELVFNSTSEFREDVCFGAAKRKVESTVVQGCHIGCLSGKSRPKDVVRAHPDVPASGRTSESADRLADGQSCGRAHSHPTEKQPGTS